MIYQSESYHNNLVVIDDGCNDVFELSRLEKISEVIPSGAALWREHGHESAYQNKNMGFGRVNTRSKDLFWEGF